MNAAIAKATKKRKPAVLEPATKHPRTDDILIGQRIRALRKLKGLSQEKLGDRCGITFQQIQKYEKGTNRIGFSRMVQIASALEITINELVPEQYRAKGDPGAVDDMLNTATEVGQLVADYNACSRKNRRTLVQCAGALSGRIRE